MAARDFRLRAGSKKGRAEEVESKREREASVRPAPVVSFSRACTDITAAGLRKLVEQAEVRDEHHRIHRPPPKAHAEGTAICADCQATKLTPDEYRCQNCGCIWPSKE